jgi:hypothetical protein
MRDEKDPRLALLQGRIEHEGITYSYEAGFQAWHVHIRGTGQLRRSGRTIQVPPLAVPYSGTATLNFDTDGWRWDPLELMLPDEVIPETYVKQYRRQIRDGWATVAGQLKIPARIKLRLMLEKRSLLAMRYEGFLGLALGIAYAQSELDAYLAQIGEDLVLPPTEDANAWNMAVNSHMDFLRKFGKQINDYSEQFEQTLRRKEQ